uniref:Uncharacterized protein n=1 Tax=Octopus bimaculoides TaxID=37653 RepID=A0A0L8FN16_OCTBM
MQVVDDRDMGDAKLYHKLTCSLHWIGSNDLSKNFPTNVIYIHIYTRLNIHIFFISFFSHNFIYNHFFFISRYKQLKLVAISLEIKDRIFIIIIIINITIIVAVVAILYKEL